MGGCPGWKGSMGKGRNICNTFYNKDNFLIKTNEAFILSISSRLVVTFVSCSRPVQNYVEIRIEGCFKFDIENSRWERG